MSISRAFHVIDYLARRESSSLRGMANALGLPVGSAHRLLTQLESEGVAERTPAGEWALGFRMLEIVGTQLSRIGLPALARPYLEELAGQTNQTAFLGVRSGGDVVYLDKVQSDAHVQMYVELGTRRPLHATGLGKAMLAFTPERQQEAFLRGATLTSITEHTITDPATLRRQLAAARRRGFAVDKHETAAGVCCIAAPLLDLAGNVAGAVSVAGTDARIADEDPAVVQQVLDAGAEVSRRLGAGP